MTIQDDRTLAVLPPRGRPDAGDAEPVPPPSRWWAVLVPGIPCALAAALGLWGADRLSLWRDEAVTVGVSQRSVGDILRLVSDVDAVHAAYYLLMHGVIALFGTGEFALRLPSIIAFAATAAGVAALGRRLVSLLGGLLAGVLYAASPFADRYAHEARPYAIATALAVLATLLLVRAVETGTWRRWGLYGAALALLGAVHLFALLVVPAHLVALAGARRAVRRWLVAVSGAGVALSGLIAVAASQRRVLEWVPRPGWRDARWLAEGFAGSPALLWLLGAAALAGAVSARRRGPVDVRMLAVPWLVLPPAVLLAVSQFHPCYVNRYVIASLPAFSLLAAAGLARLPRGTWAVALVAVAVLVAPRQDEVRRPETAWDQMREASAIIGGRARQGDAVAYVPITKRLVAEAYPGPFRELRDIGLAVPPARAANFGGSEAGAAELRDRLHDPAVRRVWLLEGEWPVRDGTLDAQNRAKIDALEAGFPHREAWRVRGLTITLYAR
ncbi:glycosyltransferase family 39 protein [Actinomadura fibrosa]|uniref:Glycosyltransferase family 39 protein n=1 Tax=Actinomadura fibrosa TaxID=111802 RepID=A0ABW2XLZ4_9ACTN|nr:glycosyltransferase family 39 protein [Actinomadura fibrosa]